MSNVKCVCGEIMLPAMITRKYVRQAKITITEVGFVCETCGHTFIPKEDDNKYCMCTYELL